VNAAINNRGRPAHSALIIWSPIAGIPDDRHDGRDVLLWTGHLLLGSWCDGWRDAVGRTIQGVTHYADVEGPDHG